MTELKEIYQHYYEKAETVRAKASIFDGFWGFGKDPAKDACHEVFYERAQEWVEKFDDTDPDRVLEVVKFILNAPLEQHAKGVHDYLFAAHGLILPLIPRLRSADCGELARWYDANFPKRQRLPLQQKVWKTLKDMGK